MIGTFIDKATGILNRQFILSYWLPSLIAFILIILFNSFFLGSGPAQLWWQQIQCFISSNQGCEKTLQLELIIYIISGVTILAYILQIFANRIVRFYEGYWFYFPLNIISERLRQKHRKELKKIYNAREAAFNNHDFQLLNSLQKRIYIEYPSDERFILPTRIGNILRSAELYSTECYGMDSNFWWPRLWPILPEKFKNQIDDSLTPLLALLIFSTLITIFTIVSLIYNFYQNISNSSLLSLGIGSLFLTLSIIISWVSYRSATTQAINYGMNIRAAVDLYRLDLLKELHMPLPGNLDEELETWNKLFKWLYTKDRCMAPNYTHKIQSDEKK